MFTKDILTLKTEGAVEIKGTKPHVLVDRLGQVWVEEEGQNNICHPVDVENIIFPVIETVTTE